MKKSKLLLPLISCLVLLGLFCGASYLLIERVSDILFEEMKSNLHETNLQNSKFLQRAIADDFNLIRTVANTFEQQELINQEEYSPYLASFVEQKQFIRLTFCDAQGNAVTSDRGTFDASGTEVFETCLRRKNYLSAPLEDRFGGESVLLFACPVVREGEAAGFVSGTKCLSDASEVLSQSFYNGKGFTCVVDDTGRMILSPEQRDGSGHPLSLTDFVGQQASRQISAAVRQGGEGVLCAVLDGTEQLLSYTPVEGGSGWYVLSIVPLSAVSGQSKKIVNAALLLCLLVALLLIGAFGSVLVNRNRSRRKIETLAYRDAVTQGDNWNKFVRDAGLLLARSHKAEYVLVVMDINHFKFINDRFGYQEGNQVLRHLSDTLRAAVRDRELSARYNGDHFAALLEFRDNGSLLERLELIWKQIGSFHGTGVARYQLSLSSGIYQVEPQDSPNTAYDRALLALNTIKGRHGNSCAFYSEQMRSAALREQEIANEMHAALRNREFIVYLQPKFCLGDETLVGAEALLRWKHPGKGMIPPDEFIPLFERNGFIVEIDLYVLETICIKMRQWMDEGLNPLPVSVNISRVHLHDPNFVEHLNKILAKYSIPPRLIELELTESIFFENITAMLSMMEQLHQIGFVLSMDDFGSGYSSLNLLKAIPVDVLKIDKEFLGRSEDDGRSRRIISGVIAIARDLDMKVLSEGVETAEQAEFLKNAHCDYVQGYYFSKPLPVDRFEEFVRQMRADEKR